MLKSLVIPGVHVAADKPVAKREGAFRIFAAPMFLFAIALLLGGGYIIEDQLSARLHRSHTRCLRGRSLSRRLSRCWQNCFTSQTAIARMRTT